MRRSANKEIAQNREKSGQRLAERDRWSHAAPWRRLRTSPMAVPRLTTSSAAKVPAADATVPAAPVASPADGRTVRLSPRVERLPRIQTLGRRWLPHEDLYHQVLNRSWSQLFLLIALTFLAANAFFAVFYWAVPGAIANARPGSFEDAFFFSVQ